MNSLLVSFALTGIIYGLANADLLNFEQATQASLRRPNPLDSLLQNTPALAAVVHKAEQYELQVIYTRIERNAAGEPRFRQFSYRLNDKAYFNPASLVKLPVAMLSLEKLHAIQQQVPALSRNSIMATGVASRCQTAVPFATSADTNKVATLGNYIKRMLLVSDNQAYNRLYKFLGQQYLHQRLAAIGYPSVRITRRFASCDTAANRCTNPITFYSTAGNLLYHQPAACNSSPLRPALGRVTKGRGYYQAGKLVAQPYDFTTGNYLPLKVVNDLLRQVLFPRSADEALGINLTSADYEFLRTYLSSTPSESGFITYASPKYFPAYKKYLYYGRQQQAQPKPSLRIYNIVGMSYGYLADCAYFADEQSGIEFMLSAVLYVNKDEVINDGRYEYTSIGLPFLKNLGQAVYEYEKAHSHAFSNRRGEAGKR